MAKASRSGITVHQADVPIILGMIQRGDRKHDIAAWFGLNQGRIADAEEGKYGNHSPAPASKLPPAGSPGPRARALRAEAQRVLQLMKNGDQTAINRLADAIADFDKDVD